ncbi:polysaccharide biosynthesis/export family protein [Sulfurimonas sp. HSL1-2]|uniref:polysaccharide biosynthesis/export family protein n=1 Tax=Thiomicrolovo zhangzhouensis TaxID=3131933 RepID=UPI0031F82CED
MLTTVMTFSLILFSGCSIKQYKLFQAEENQTIEYRATPEKLEESVRYENKISPGDRVSINVFNVYRQSAAGTEQLQATSATSTSSSAGTLLNNQDGYLVSQDGNVYVPLIGEVSLQGMTTAEASKSLTEKYAKYLRHPFVTVKILNQRVYVLGEVKSPGMIPVLNETMTIFEAIARCGDFGDYGKRNDVMIIRGNLNNNPEIRLIDMSHMASLHVSDLVLRPNDIVYVQPRDMKATNIAIREITPILSLISQTLTTWVALDYFTK